MFFLCQLQKRIFRNVYTDKIISWDPNLWPGPTGNENSSCTMVRARIKVTKGMLKLFSYICQGARQGLPGQAELQQSSAMLRMPIRSRLPQNGAGFALLLCLLQFMCSAVLERSLRGRLGRLRHGVLRARDRQWKNALQVSMCSSGFCCCCSCCSFNCCCWCYLGCCWYCLVCCY